ncbi:hypothetical protein O3M35_008767 [Rhynocoris fuscipes]|uniref:Odorant receptor n=1 Tax=Rhynocoris fuscipes TaxID=488301 RepID=A0AAW1DEE7_9HEMI
MSPIKFACNFARIFGLLNSEDRPWGLILTVYHVFMLIWGLFGPLIFAVLKSDNLTEMFQGLSLVFGYIHLTGKVINILAQEKKIRKLLGRLEIVRLETMENDEAETFILRADKFLIKFNIIYSTLIVSFPFTSATLNFIDNYKTEFKNLHLAFPIWIPWNINEFWKYLGGLICQVLVLVTGNGYYGSFVALQFTFAFQISGFLKALQHHLETYGPNSKTIYQQHANIIGLIKEYNSIFSGQMYLEILVSPVQPCGFGYALIKALSRNDQSAFSLIPITMVTVTTSFTVCYSGQEVHTQMENLHASAYMNSWYEEKPKVRRDLLQMMILTKNPTVFNYRRWVHFDYVTFSTVMQGVYTYLSMMAHFAN